MIESINYICSRCGRKFVLDINTKPSQVIIVSKIKLLEGKIVDICPKCNESYEKWYNERGFETR